MVTRKPALSLTFIFTDICPKKTEMLIDTGAWHTQMLKRVRLQAIHSSSSAIL